MTTSSFPAILPEALGYLTGLAADDADPTTARQRLDALRARHPDLRLRVVWQREEYDGSLQYDLLIARASGDVVSLAFCPNRTLPWSFRGGHRAGERLLLRVNGVPMEIDQAITCLDLLWDEAPLMDRLVTACLLQQVLEEAPVTLTAHELQAAMDAFRRARGLLTATATAEWMARRGLTHSSLEKLVAAEAAVGALRQRVTARQASAYFAAHRQQLATARLARLSFPTRQAALDTLQEIQAGADFLAVAERSFAVGRLTDSAALFWVVRRDELAEEIGNQVFEVPPGTTLGPYATEDGYAVIKVIAVTEAVLDETTAALIEQRLFARWLDSRRRTAHVEWFWGSAVRTGAPS